MDSLEISRLKLAMIHSTKNSNHNSFCTLTQCNREMSKRIVTGEFNTVFGDAYEFSTFSFIDTDLIPLLTNT